MRSTPAIFACFALACLLFSGCAEGLYWVRSINPSVRSRWAEEEKTYGANWETKRTDMREVAAAAGGMEPAKQAEWSSRLAKIVRDDKNVLMRTEAVRALGSFPTPTATSAIIAALSDEAPAVRTAACEAAAKRGDPESVAKLAETVEKDADVDVQIAAVRALGTVENKASTQPAMRGLAVALDQRDPALRHRAVESLRNLSGADYGQDMDAWRKLARGETPPRPNSPTIAESFGNWFR